MDHTMNGGSAVAFFCFSLRIQPFYPFQIVVLVEGEIEGRVSIASRASWYQLAIFESYFSNPNSKCLLGCAQTPFDLHRADAGCAFVPNTSITKKQPRTLPQWKNPRLSSSIGTAFFRWCSFLLRRTVLHCAAHEEAPASRLLLCGSPGRRLSFPSAAWNILHPVP